MGNLVDFIAFLLTYLCCSVSSQQCYQTKAEFTAACDTAYQGVINGARCFFLAGTGTNYPGGTWADAWTLCAAQGGSMAQIHTANEFSAIRSYLMTKFSNVSKPIMVAMSRDPSLTNTSTGKAMDLQKSRWYDNSNTYNPLLIAGNTWIRTHELDDAFAPNSNCYMTFSMFSKLGDASCNNNYTPICTVYNSIQNFSLISTTGNGNCMTETVIRTFSAVPSTTDCAIHCTENIWCRGYNYYLIAQKCELFSWFYQDTTAFVMNSDCYHYAYVP